ncbi:MAG: hypothetical protein HN704_17555 [Bacteroidetes bacterium]|jgi:hypothetical protein|nr:hypothetical protein [Bacteroidota bacterium]MBT6686103.1 hypothetical protein [Bacteroidota bacterium]MBT7143247.1 hypothetical protein [Bacteroidota bacterium]MBT7493407.1 hypothetical protein [Bacteroidota bacterium]
MKILINCDNADEYVGIGTSQSERNIRGPIQNGFHNLRLFGRQLISVTGFEVLNIQDRFYGGYYSSNPYTLW